METSKATSSDQKSPLPNASLPNASLPKGGGAIQGMGEKFAANPVTGTASMTIPLATSPGRNNFGPSLSLSYDSGNGNGPFGFGWRLSVPSITRKTNKGLPRYDDDIESDTFILAGSEDLVPTLNPDGSMFEDKISAPGYSIRRYQPRIEGSFARIERWTNISDLTDIHWRHLSSENVLTTYGVSTNSRISNPKKQEQIFEWLISESRDCKGNGVFYTYKAEDSLGVDLSLAHQRNRGPLTDGRRTSNRYLKSVVYGNQISLLDESGNRPLILSQAQIKNAGWMFEAVFDFGEHDVSTPIPNGNSQSWHYRHDSFSSYRSGFEVRTSRICRRFLMFHHFQEEAEVGLDCLVHSTDFTYIEGEPGVNNLYTYLTSAQQCGYRRNGGGYTRRVVPPLEFTYSHPSIQDELKSVDSSTLGNLPAGLASTNAQWIDLYGEGISGVLTTDSQAWYYKRNITPLNEVVQDGIRVTKPMFSELEITLTKPNVTTSAQNQFADLTGEGFLSVLYEGDGLIGFYQHDGKENWLPFQPLPHAVNQKSLFSPDVKLIDLDGDGIADVLIPADNMWYESLGKDGFAPPQLFQDFDDEEEGPSHVFSNDVESIRLADLSGDGLSDIVRIRNGEVCYWPNLGYGRFGAKISMDNSPIFDHCDQFSTNRIILSDIDGSGTTDIIYLHRNKVRVYFNQCGNAWSEPHILESIPPIDNITSTLASDLHGNGTACLVISSPISQGTEGQSMWYVDLMGAIKPHLLLRVDNNLGASTEITYGTSTKFYLRDKLDGKPWVTRLPFPVQVVESVHIYDHISKNIFGTRYEYHHGYFDPEDREFRGFGMVEQWDSEGIFALTTRDSSNLSITSDLPPVHTKTWFHQGAFVGHESISLQYKHEYFRDPGLDDDEARKWLLPDTVLPPNVTLEDEHDACRALKGKMLRQEVYADDAPPGSTTEVIQKSLLPYTVVESNFSLEMIQPRLSNRSAIFITTTRETISYNYERNPSDPRIKHSLILETNKFGQILKELSISYGRRISDSSLPTEWDKSRQHQSLVTYSENTTTNIVDDPILYPHTFRLPKLCETRTFELTGFEIGNVAGPVLLEDWTRNSFERIETAAEIGFEETPVLSARQKRLLKHDRTLFRKDDLTGLLALAKLEPMAIPGQSYKLSLTSNMIDLYFKKDGVPLLADPTALLTGQRASQGGYITSGSLKTASLFPISDHDSQYWIPSGQTLFALDDDPAQVLASARQHFYLPFRFRNQFKAESRVTYDKYNLLVLETEDFIGNRMTVGERDIQGAISRNGNDYRVLQPRVMTEVNGNRTEIAFDAMGLVVGTAVKGKPGENLGDDLATFNADLEETEVLKHIAQPMVDPNTILGGATTRVLYDAFAYVRSRDSGSPQPAATYSMTRTTHQADLVGNAQTEIHHAFSYSDGFGRQIQKKVQTKAGPASKRDDKGNITLDPGRQPILTSTSIDPRWISDGWVIYNNKGLPVCQFEPFFTDQHGFEFDVRAGVSPIMFYDALGRVAATLNPNNTYTKQLFDPWKSAVWDCNDTVSLDPRTDPDVEQYTAAYFAAQADEPPFVTWLAARLNNDLGEDERIAAEKTTAHAGTPNITYFDALGRQFLTVSHNKVKAKDHELDGTEALLYSRSELDIQGNKRAIRDATIQNSDLVGRIVETTEYDMLGKMISKVSMEKGPSWVLNNAAGQPMRAWNNRGHILRSAYDSASRLMYTSLLGDVMSSKGPSVEVEVERIVYGESHPESESRNLRGSIYLKLDQATASTTDRKDFKGNALETTQRLCSDFKNTVDWGTMDTVIPEDLRRPFDPTVLEGVLAAKLETEKYVASSTYDALNRVLSSTLPHAADGKISSLRLGYDVLSLVHIDYNIQGEASAGQPIWTPFVKDLDYNAFGQRRYIDYGNGVRTNYAYDIEHNLVQLTTIRGMSSSSPDTVQDIKYTYDPMHNITNIVDLAQQTIFFRNVVVKPVNSYTFDALYRLIEATGREHLGQPGGAPNWSSNSDAARFGPHPGDGNAMGLYTEQYLYDNTANLLKIKHDSSDTQQVSGPRSWTRTFIYGEQSRIEPGKFGNRLSSSSVGGLIENFAYDAHGNTVHMPHLGGSASTENLQWDYLDKMKQLDLGGGGTAYYTYDSAGQRVRKVVEKGPNLVEERLYLGSIDIFRKKKSGQTTFERETLHAMDNEKRIAMVETRTLDTEGNDHAPAQLIRYQIATLLGSSSIELDKDAQILSFEEYSPYGSTTYQGATPSLETPKRYRFTGKERDEESGFSYHGARYYAPWLGRWTNTDPIGIGDGPNMYIYCHGNPVIGSDPSGMSDETSFASFDPLMSSIAESDYQSKLVDTRPALTPLATPMSVPEARAHANSQAADYRASPAPETPYLETQSVAPWEGGQVQAGHTVTARHAPESGISKADWDNQSFQRLPSEKGQGLDVAVMDQSGDVKVTTRHRTQDYSMIDPAIEDVKTANGGALSPRGQMDVGEYTEWRSRNVPLDQGNIDFVRGGGAAPIDKTITTEMKLAAAEGDLFAKAAKAAKAGKAAGRGAKALKLLGKAGRHFVAAIPIAGIIIGHASAANAAMSGDIKGAALDEAGFIPVAGDLLDAARGGVALGQALDEGLGISDIAAAHGESVRKAAKSLGLSDDTALYLGAGGAGLSAITVAPSIALDNTVTNLANAGANRIRGWLGKK